jgi:hypothetical protein
MAASQVPAQRYDEAIVSLGFLVILMNFDLKLAPQAFFFSTAIGTSDGGTSLKGTSLPFCPRP